MDDVTERDAKLTDVLPAVAGGVGMTAVATAVFGLAGTWWGLLAVGVLLIVWAVLAAAGGRQ